MGSNPQVVFNKQFMLKWFTLHCKYTVVLFSSSTIYWHFITKITFIIILLQIQLNKMFKVFMWCKCTIESPLTLVELGLQSEKTLFLSSLHTTEWVYLFTNVKLFCLLCCNWFQGFEQTLSKTLHTLTLIEIHQTENKKAQPFVTLNLFTCGCGVNDCHPKWCCQYVGYIEWQAFLLEMLHTERWMPPSWSSLPLLL